MKKIYVGCSLYGATEEFKQSVNSFKDSLRNNFEVLDFLGKNNGTPEEIVTYDLGMLRSCDYFIAICDSVSTGLGIEIGTANYLKKPTLLSARSDDVSNMVRGNHVENENCEFFLYKDFKNLKDKVLDFCK